METMILVWLAGSVAGALILAQRTPKLYRAAKYAVSIRCTMMRFSQALRRQELLMSRFLYAPHPRYLREHGLTSKFW
jgi:hypothetical protein